MAVSLQGYIRDFMQTFVFFSSNVQTTTIAIAITGSICCSIIWFIINVISAAVSDGQRTLSSPRLCAGSHRLKHSMFLPCQPAVHAHNSTRHKRHSASCRMKRLHSVVKGPLTCQPCFIFSADCTIQWAYQRCQRHLCLRSYRTRDVKAYCCHSNRRPSKPQTMRWKKPTELDFSHSKLRQCPARLSFMGPQLTQLNLSHNSLCHIPDEICCLTGLREMYLHHNHLTSIPKSVGGLTELTDLNLDHNQLTTLPESLGDLRRLQNLSLSGNRLESLPRRLYMLMNLAILRASNNNLTELPDGLCRGLTRLKFLKLSKNWLRSLPLDIGQLLRLEKLDVSMCHLTYLPHTLCLCPALSTLRLSNNRLRELPSRLGELPCLQELYVDGNQLCYLPASLVNTKLKSLTVCANPLETKTSAPWKGNGEVLIGTAGFPSLQELTARNITANTVPWMKCNLPVSLKELLENIRWCEYCGRYFFKYFQSRLEFVHIAGHQDVPVCHQICAASGERKCQFSAMPS
ncbi:hypothetical protein NP493_995g00056 [Ridgeia piscesae]|uniref:Uncharacterized protein n=1 Tax=Ridgeia piscesae TaxID=27915 RepID=A0AAD9KJX9_RIDPI|nr:hypothetical protein NP493_995g00056 [Ridgeia piscesae]